MVSTNLANFTQFSKFHAICTKFTNFTPQVVKQDRILWTIFKWTNAGEIDSTRVFSHKSGFDLCGHVKCQNIRNWCASNYVSLYNAWCVVCYECDYDLWAHNFSETINLHQRGNTIKEETIFFPPKAQQPPSVPRPPQYRGFTITLRHTTVGRNPLDEYSARGRDLYLKNTQLSHSHPPPGRDSNPQFPASEQPQTHALYRAATGIWQRNIPHTIKTGEKIWIGYILLSYCLLKHVIEGKTQGKIEVTRRRWRRGILHTIKTRGEIWIGYILLSYCLLKHVIERKTQGKIEVTRRRWRRGILHTIKTREKIWIGYILLSYCLLTHVIEGKTQAKIEVTRRQWRRDILHTIKTRGKFGLVTSCLVTTF